MSPQDEERAKVLRDFLEYRKRNAVQRHRTEAAELHRTAAFDDLETRSENAWKSDFQQKLARAKSYLPTTRARTEQDREAVQDFIQYLTKKLLSGRPEGSNRPWTKDEQGVERRVEQHLRDERVLILAAVDAAAQLVREGQMVWREENDRQRVRRAVTEKLENDSIMGIATQWSLPPAMASQMRRLVRKYREKKKK
jgi:hypothetical protein